MLFNFFHVTLCSCLDGGALYDVVRGKCCVLHLFFALWQVCIHVFSTHSFLCKHIADPATDQRMAHFSLVHPPPPPPPPTKVLTFMVHGCGRLPLIWLFHGSPCVSKQNLNRLNFPSVNQRRASKANNKAVLNWFDTDILNRPRETSSRNSEHKGIYILAPCRHDKRHSVTERLETWSALTGGITFAPILPKTHAACCTFWITEAIKCLPFAYLFILVYKLS